MSSYVYIKSYGCQMNVYDSERILEILFLVGYKRTFNIKVANLVILNTCYIREKASEKVFSDLGRLKVIQKNRKLKKNDDEMIIGVSGCVAQAEGQNIQKRAPYVDMVFGPQVYHRLPFFLKKIKNSINHKKKSDKWVTDVDFPIQFKFDYLNSPTSFGVSKFLSIQEGCDKFCNFCVVPYTRGVEFSRPVLDIIREAKLYISQGVKEIILLGQNVSSYLGRDGYDFRDLAWLLYRLSELDGLKRLRYTTSHPKDITANLVQSYRDISILMPYLHLPIQSGSDRLLRLMNRDYTVKDYCRIIDLLRKFCPDIAISTDFIVGYPGETEEDFAQTLNLVRNVEFAQSYSFKYSPRPGTLSSKSKNHLNESVKADRLHHLQDLLFSQQLSFNSLSVSNSYSVLVEKFDKVTKCKIGLTPYLQPVYFRDINNICNLGDVVSVFITNFNLKSLEGVF